MTALSIALVIVAVLAWDIARRYLQSPSMAKLEAVEAELVKTDKVVKELALDWRAKFSQLEAAQKDKTRELENKVATSVATLVPTKGYNR
jgi:Tfp pilus assembly protein PilE